MRDNPFPDIPNTPAGHFKLYFYAAVLGLLERLYDASDNPDDALKQFPFLVGYSNELALRGLEGMSPVRATVWWRDALCDWESAVDGHLPLRALREAAGLDYASLVLLVSIGLIDEDSRFGGLFEHLQGVPMQRRPTLGLLTTWSGVDDPHQAKAAARRLLSLGVVEPTNPNEPRSEWWLHIPPNIWDALHGEIPHEANSWAIYRAPTSLSTYDELVLPQETLHTVEAVPALLADGEARALVIRGPRHNGRRTVLGAVARRLGMGLLEAQWSVQLREERWRTLGPLATLLNAMPAIVLDLAPGETADLPPLHGYTGPLGVVLGSQGGLAGPAIERALTITLPISGERERRVHWLCGFGERPPCEAELDDISARFRLTSGNIRSAARLAQSYAALNRRSVASAHDVRQGAHALNRQALDTLATYLPGIGDWSRLAVRPETLGELYTLASRCRNRERLGSAVGEALGAQLNPGVRALFTGASGTGKTLAARLLADALQADLYRVDLASVVNKYIGETEKSLNQVFSRAEELDVVLLLDEGDALLTQRTNVQNSNDRYANLETNYLLQRLEAFEGILIVTTNAGQRIDTAFQRRMDVVINFHPPDMAERWHIWQMHLPPEHKIDAAFLDEVARRCQLSGGQIRNAVLHASLLALNSSSPITTAHIQATVEREYRKMGAACPLREVSVLAADWD